MTSKKTQTTTEPVEDFSFLMPEFDASASGAHMPAIEQYFGLWSIDPTIGRQLAGRMQGVNLMEHVRMQQTTVVVSGDQAATPDKSLGRKRGSARILPGGVALVDIAGTVQKYASSFSASTSTVNVRQQIREADRDPAVSEILIRIDSPGGTVSGIAELYDDIRQAKTPTTVFVEDLAASAGYWVAAAADRVFANAAARIGSIGVFMAVEDVSEAAEKLGVKVHVIKTGEFKGAGVPGSQLTEAHLQYLQSLVDTSFDHFIAAVSTGRNMKKTEVKTVADGRVYPASESVELGLIDGVKSFDEVLAELQTGRAGSASRTRSKAVSETNTDTTPQAATLAEIKAAAPGCTNDFAVEQLEASATVDQIRAAYQKQQAEQIATLTADNEKLSAKVDELETAAAKKDTASSDGSEAVNAGAASGETTTDSTDPVAAWNGHVSAKQKNGLSRQDAVKACVREFPDAHKAYLGAV